jgi:hypothetical protein
MIYLYDNNRWFVPRCELITMDHVFESMVDDYYNDRLIYVGY